MDLQLLKTRLKAEQCPSWFIETQLGTKMFDSQREIMDRFYGDGFRRLVCVAGMRSGKSALAAMMSVYELFMLLSLPNPAKHFGLLSKQPITISVVATSESQAEDTVFANARNMVEESDVFSTWDLRVRDLSVKSKEKNVEMKTLSSWSTTAVGRSNKAVVFDELANFEETNGKRGAWEIYSRLSKSTDTFGVYGKTVAISSPKHPNDIIMTLFKQGEDGNTLVIKKPTWEMNPNYTKEKLMEENKFNMASFWRDYACQPSVMGANEFIDVKLAKIKNVLYDKGHVDEKMRVMAIDPSVKKDAFGIAVGYTTDEKGSIVVDGVTALKSVETALIPIEDIKRVIYGAIERLGVYAMVFDTWMYPELVQDVERKYGVETHKHIVRKRDYDRIDELWEKNELTVVWDDLLQKEFEQLVVINEKKVDHPITGSKDVADCVANVVWYLKEFEVIGGINQKPPIALVAGF